MEAPRKSQSTTPIIEPQVEKNTKKKPVGARPPPHIINPAYVPFPARLKHQQYTKDYGHFLNIFSQLNVNLPFVKVLQHMPKYAKFFKDLLKRKDRLLELSTVPLNGECFAVVLNKVPEKLPDPSVFTIPCLFGSDTTCQALADLGASINLMSYSIYEKLSLGELTPTPMTLSLADCSVKYPRGVVENLLIKVNNLVFPAYFVVLDMEADERVPIILGRPFLRTARAIIDVFEGKITLRSGDDSATYLAKSMRHPSGQDGLIDPCHPVYLIESSISGMDPSLDESRSVSLRVGKERKVSSSRVMVKCVGKRGGGKCKFEKVRGVRKKKTKIDEWSDRDSISLRAFEFYRGGGRSTRSAT